jgi:transcriptional regulator with XRE-family HTH domain
VPKSTFTPQYTYVREALIAARHAAGLTQRDVATRLQRPPSYVANCETGERRLDVIEFFEFAQAVNADPLAILSELAQRWYE